MTDWNSYTVSELKDKAAEYGVAIAPDWRKPQIVAAMEARQAEIEAELAATSDAEEPDEDDRVVDVVEPEQDHSDDSPGEPPAPPQAVLRATAGGLRLQLSGLERSFRQGRPTSAVRALQRELTRNGHYAGRLDGVPGEITRNAVSAANYDATGERNEVPTQALLEALGFDVR